MVSANDFAAGLGAAEVRFCISADREPAKHKSCHGLLAGSGANTGNKNDMAHWRL
jgi:hypothetical protein